MSKDIVTQKQLLYERVEVDKDELFALLGSLIQINSENFGSHGNEKHVRNMSKTIRKERYEP